MEIPDQPDEAPKKPQSVMGRRGRFLLHVAMLAVLAVAAWIYIDFAELWAALRHVPLPMVALILVLCWVDRTAMALKWQPLLRAVGVHVPTKEIIWVYFEGSFVAYLLPSALGGDALRIFRVSKLTGKTAAVLSSAAVEKVVGVISAGLIATAGCAALAGELAGSDLHTLLLVVPACVALAVVVFGLSLSTTLGATLVRLVPLKAVRRAAGKFLEAYQAYREKRGVVLCGILFSALEQGLQLFIEVLAARAVGVEADTAMLAGALALSGFLRKIAVAIEGWGLGTLVSVGVLALVGIDENQAVALTLLTTVLGGISVLPGGLLLLRTRRSGPDA